jgi:hypothetical protein
MDDRTPKDGGGANHHYNVQGNHEQRNQQADLPLFNIKIMITQMTCERKKKMG